MRVKTKDKESLGVAGSIFIRPPGLMHEECCTSSVRLEAQVIFWKPTGNKAGLSSLPTESFDTTGRVLHCMTWLNELHATPDLARHYLDDLLGLILLECRKAVQPLADNRWSAVTSYVFQHLAEPLTLDAMARLAGMSRNYFVEEFHREMGISPMAYVRKARLDRACQMITQSGSILAEIAQKTGFRDEYELSRVFRRVMGFAPSTLRPLRGAGFRADSGIGTAKSEVRPQVSM